MLLGKKNFVRCLVDSNISLAAPLARLASVSPRPSPSPPTIMNTPSFFSFSGVVCGFLRADMEENAANGPLSQWRASSELPVPEKRVSLA